MIEATSCGGVVIYRVKVLVLYKKYRNKYEGWVLPKGTVEANESFEDTAIREVREEGGSNAVIKQFIDTTQYTFSTAKDTVYKKVNWFLMQANSYYNKPQREEFFEDSGFYKYHEAYHLLRFPNEKQILEKAYEVYINMKRQGVW